MDAILPTKDLMNRSEKRKFKKDAMKCVGVLERINTAFVWEVFNAPKRLTYNEIYEAYNVKWCEAIKDLIETRKIKHCLIDILWFSENYKPNQTI